MFFRIATWHFRDLRIYVGVLRDVTLQIRVHHSATYWSNSEVIEERPNFRSGRSLAAVDHQVRTGEERRLTRGEEQCACGNLFGIANTAHRYGDRGGGVVAGDWCGESSQAGCVNGSRAQRSDTDAARCQFGLPGAREIADRSFGYPVNTHA